MSEEKETKKGSRMTLLDYIAKGILSVWKFTTNIFTILLFVSFLAIILMVFMPDNVIKAIEIIKSIFMQGG